MYIFFCFNAANLFVLIEYRFCDKLKFDIQHLQSKALLNCDSFDAKCFFGKLNRFWGFYEFENKNFFQNFNLIKRFLLVFKNLKCSLEFI